MNKFETCFDNSSKRCRDIVGHVVSVDVVYSNTDTIEGRGQRVIVGIAPTHSVAKEIAKGQGVMGTDARIETHPALVFHDENHCWAVLLSDIHFVGLQETKEELRQKALSKLTDEEIQLLGLTK